MAILSFQYFPQGVTRLKHECLKIFSTTVSSKSYAPTAVCPIDTSVVWQKPQAFDWSLFNTQINARGFTSSLLVLHYGWYGSQTDQQFSSNSSYGNSVFLLIWCYLTYKCSIIM
jgi:hypothetical protein